MRWKKIDNTIRIQNKGKYNDWKQQISDDCFNQCVYCSIHESPWGGIDHYHIDHFKPKSKFVALTHIITNLYHACPVCNKFKSDDWPNENNSLDEICYPDPSEYDYTELFELNVDNYTIIGKYIASNYLINRLYLNRPQLIYERRESVLKYRAEVAIEEAKRLISICNDTILIKQAFELLAKIAQHLHIRTKIQPYRLVEIQKK